MNVKVAMLIYVKKEQGGWTRYPAWRGANDRYAAGAARVGGKKKGSRQDFETFVYQLRTFEGRKPVFESVGTDPLIAAAKLEEKQKARNLVRDGAGVEGVTVTVKTERRLFAEAAKEYVERTVDGGFTKAAADIYACGYAMFQEALPEVRYVDQINEKLMLRFQRWLRDERGNGDASVANRHRQIMTLLIWCGVEGGNPKELRKLLGKPPKVDKKLPEVYDEEELETLWVTLQDPKTILYINPRPGDRSKTNEYFYTVLRLLQMTGLREAEAANLMWSDVDFKRKEIHVRSHPHLNFKLKDRESRKVTIPAKLIPILEARRKVVPNARLVVGRADDTPQVHWLLSLKRLAGLADLNCTHCQMCIEPAEMYSDGISISGCEHWTLHGFRRTYATALHEAGKSVREIMILLGHSDIQTTMRYIGARREASLDDIW